MPKNTAPFLACRRCIRKWNALHVVCKLCIANEDYRERMAAKSLAAIPTYTPMTADTQWVDMEDALQATHCEFLPVSLTLEQVGDMAAEWHALAKGRKG